MLVILKPVLFRARTADSRPGPGPLTITSRFFRPYSCAAWPARSAATWAANGVLLREPRKPEPPEVAQLRVLPWRSVIVIIVLLKDAKICATPSTTVLFAFLRTVLLGALAIKIPGLLTVPAVWPAYFLIGLRGPLRVLALVLVRWPRSGKPRRCLNPR